MLTFYSVYLFGEGIFSEKGKWITKCKTIKENIRISSRAIFRNGQKVNAKEFCPLRVPNSLGIVNIYIRTAIWVCMCVFNGYYCALHLLGFLWDSLLVHLRCWYIKVVKLPLELKKVSWEIWMTRANISL